MTTKLCPHWIPTHTDQRDTQWLSRWQPTFTKIVFVSDHEIPQLDVALKHSPYVIARHHPVSENWESRGFRDPAHAKETAQGHAAYLGRLWNEVRKQYPSVTPDRVLWEGLNEPHEWSDEPAVLTAVYYAEFIARMAVQGLRTVALCLGVGWPGNGGITDAPPIWAPYEPIIAAIDRHGGYLGLHEYWSAQGPQSGWQWLAGRYTQCPYQVPILITECGIDAAVVQAGQYYGYRGLSPDGNVAARMFIDHLTWYDARLHEDPRIVGATVYTYDFSAGWATFDYRNQEFMTPFLAYVQAQPKHEHTGIEPAPITDPIRVLFPDGSVRVLALEEYLRGVVPAEVPALWPVEAVKAQAVAARSYARAAMLAPRHRDHNADICTTQHCQVYNPDLIHAASDAAIKATAGETLLYNGRQIAAFFSANCGGRTQSNEAVWGGEPLPYCAPVECINSGPKNGHGVGMCQWGAHDMAANGANYVTILKHYYTGVSLSSETEPDPEPEEPTVSGVAVLDSNGQVHDLAWLGATTGIHIDTSLRRPVGPNWVITSLIAVRGRRYVVSVETGGYPRSVGRHWPSAPNGWPNGVCPPDVTCPPEARDRAQLAVTGTTEQVEFTAGDGDVMDPAKGNGANLFWMPAADAGSDVLRGMGILPGDYSYMPVFELVTETVPPEEPEPLPDALRPAVLAFIADARAALDRLAAAL